MTTSGVSDPYMEWIRTRRKLEEHRYVPSNGSDEKRYLAGRQALFFTHYFESASAADRYRATELHFRFDALKSAHASNYPQTSKKK